MVLYTFNEFSKFTYIDFHYTKIETTTILWSGYFLPFFALHMFSFRVKSLAIMCNSFCMSFTCSAQENNLKSAPKTLYNDGM